MAGSFRDLIVWQKARDLATCVYRFTESFPASERYGLTNQMRRAAVSIAANIAESYHRQHEKEKHQLLTVAYSSGSELESHMEIAKAIFPSIDTGVGEALLQEVMRLLNTFLNKHNPPSVP